MQSLHISYRKGSESSAGEGGEVFSPISEVLMEEASSKAVRKAALGAGKTLKRSANQKAKSSKQKYYSQVCSFPAKWCDVFFKFFSLAHDFCLLSTDRHVYKDC